MIKLKLILILVAAYCVEGGVREAEDALAALAEGHRSEDIPVVEGDGGDIAVKVENEVLVLTADNFDILVLSKPIILVEFYAPWCGHCKTLAPELDKAAKILNENDPPIPIGKVDATVETELATKYDVTGFPTLLVFRKGERHEYDGPRTALGIIEYMTEKADPNWKPPPEQVLTLTAKTFDETVKREELMLVEFYAPWCGHCKRLAPEYERAAKQLAALPVPIILAKVDATVEKDLGKRFDVNGYPALFIFRKGKSYKYTGPREERGIVKYMREQVNPPSTVIESVNQFQKQLAPEFPAIVGFFESENDPLYEIYIDAANEQRDKEFKFFHTFDPKVTKGLKEKKGSVVLVQPERFQSDFEPSRYRMILEKNTMPSEIGYFVGNNSVPLVGHRSYNSAWLYAEKYPLVVVYYDVDFGFDNRVQTQLIRKQILKVANEFKGRITFAISKETQYEDELKELGLEDSGEDVNVGFFSSAKVRYAMKPSEDFDSEVLKEFVNNVVSGKAVPKIKSQPAPVPNDGPVTVVVGTTFQELVTESPKNVLIEFYAPWCGHCKTLEPTYKLLAQKYQDKMDVLSVAKMDATANDYPGDYEVNGFPTIYFVPANNKSHRKQYLGDRSMKDLIKFVESMLAYDFGKLGAAREEL